MELERKSYKASVKQASDTGVVEALVSVFHTVDKAKEVVRPGAFKASLSKRLPVGCWNHDWSKPVAKTLAAYETSEGLVVKAQFNLETRAGAEAYSNIKFHADSQPLEWSIGYSVVKDSYDKKAGTRNLEELELYEWSACLVGLNPDTKLISIKHAANGAEAPMSANAVEDMSTFDDRLRALETKEAQPLRPRFPGQQPTQLHEVKSLGQGWVDSREYKDWLANKPVESQVFSTGMRLKAVLTTTTGWPAESVRSDVIVPYASRQAPRVSTIIPHLETNQNSYVYLEETTLVNAAVEIAEGALKPESDLALTEKTSPIRKIATYLVATDEQLSDVPSIGQYLEQRLAFFVAQRLDNQILNGNGVSPNLLGILLTPGIQTQAKGALPTPDGIRLAMDKVRVIGQTEPNVVVAHPNDWSEVQLLRETGGQYIWGSPADAGPDRIWGKTVLVTSAMPEGTMLIGDFLNFVQLVEREQFNVKIGYAGDDFLRNRKSLVGETRVALVVLRPTAYCTLTGV